MVCRTERRTGPQGREGGIGDGNRDGNRDGDEDEDENERRQGLKWRRNPALSCCMYACILELCIYQIAHNACM